MLEEIEYWKPESLSHYVEAHIIPLNMLAKKVSEDFREFDPELSSYADKISNLTNDIIKITESIYSKSFSRHHVKKPSDIYELIEIGRDFMEKAFNFTIGANQYTFFIWSLRKITRAYLLEHYPKLKDKGIFESISRILGLKEILKPPEIEPREIFEDYILYGYPDYEIYYEEHKERTIGGLTCELNKLIWKMSGDDNIKSYDTFYQKTNLFNDYMENAEKILESSKWKPEPLYFPNEFDGASFSIEGLTVNITIGYRTQKTSPYPPYQIVEGIEYSPQEKITLFNFLDIVMLPQMLGLWELYLYSDIKRGKIKDWRCEEYG